MLKPFNIKRIIFAFIVILIAKSGYNQDTIAFMHYNLLNFGNYTDYCDNINNNESEKIEHLRNIVNYTLPDIFTVNEIANNPNFVSKVLDSCLNVENRSYYKHAIIDEYSYSSICNILFYNENKFSLFTQKSINTPYRKTNIYKLFYRSPDCELFQDTVYLTLFVTHLKAGSSPEDEDIRNEAAQEVIEYIRNENYAGNVFLSGDLNVYSSLEPAFQNLTTTANNNFIFVDPANKLGNWHDNQDFARYHTQSTHKTSGCHASGGMDDRFDFILINESVLWGTDKVTYVPESYKALGQTGETFNESFDSYFSEDLSVSLQESLFEMSDHLPVCAGFRINQTPASIELTHQAADFYINNPVSRFLHIKVPVKYLNKNSTISIFDIYGKMLYHNCLNRENLIDASSFSIGIYFCSIKTTRGIITKRIIKMNSR